MGDGVQGLMPHHDGYPMSRDYGLPNYPCKATTCLFNKMDTCIIPSRCEIGEDGVCKGYRVDKKKEEKPGD